MRGRVKEKTMMNRAMFAATVLVGQLIVPHLSVAQQADSYELRLYQGGASPVSTYGFLGADVVCDQDPPAIPGQIVNPTLVVWDDPGAAGRACVHDTVTSGSLLGLPLGAYDATLVASNSAGDSPESGRSPPFSRIDPPGVLTGLVLVP